LPVLLYDALVIEARRGLAQMVGMKVLDIPGVTGGPDNDYISQAVGALEALEQHDMVVIHIEATDDAAHAGLVEEKTEAIQAVDREIVSRLLAWDKDALRVLVLPDHATPIEVQTHVADPRPIYALGARVYSQRGQEIYRDRSKSRRHLYQGGV